MSKKLFKLSDFDSRACDIELRIGENTVRSFSLRKFSLMDRIWAESEFGSLSKWESTLFPQDENYSETEWITCLLKTAHRLLEDEHKEEFKDWEQFGGALESTVEVLIGLQKAVLYVLHGSEPLLDRFEKEVKKNLQNPMPVPQKKKTKRKTRRSTGRK